MIYGIRLVAEAGASAGPSPRLVVSWSAISQHLTVLKDAGFIVERREGTKRIYRADKVALGSLRAVVEDHWRDGLNAIKHLAEADQHSKDHS